MINWARHNERNGIHTIVSRPMLTILKRSGWQIKTLKEAFLSERERIYLVFLSTEAEDRDQMASGFISECGYPEESVITWPLSCDKLQPDTLPDRLAGVTNAQLGDNIAHMKLHRTYGNTCDGGNLTIGFSQLDQ